MASLKDYFDTDFKNTLSVRSYLKMRSDKSSEEIEAVERVHLDFDSNTKYISYYVPQTTNIFDVCLSLIKDPKRALASSESVEVQSGFVGEEKSSSSELKFSGRIFIYTENELTIEQIGQLKVVATKLGVSIRIRGPKLVTERSKLERPLAFISHDGRDKNDIARPLAIQLSSMICPVWFDEFSLKVGNSLRQSIEKGLKECEKCILVLSPNFLSNEGWTKKEFDSIFTRELLGNEQVILPIWCNVSKKDIYNYSPSLADRYAVNWSLGQKEVARQLYKAIIN
jgi:hypothetical protein